MFVVCQDVCYKDLFLPYFFIIFYSNVNEKGGRMNEKLPQRQLFFSSSSFFLLSITAKSILVISSNNWVLQYFFCFYNLENVSTWERKLRFLKYVGVECDKSKKNLLLLLWENKKRKYGKNRKEKNHLIYVGRISSDCSFEGNFMLITFALCNIYIVFEEHILQSP